MKLIGLAELARRVGKSRKSLLTQLRALEESTPHLRGLVIVHVGKAKKIWVNAVVLEHIQDQTRRELDNRVKRLEARMRQIEVRADELEATRHAS